MVGAGNVALDVVRVLVRGVDELRATDMPDEVLEALTTRGVRDVHLLARRGPAYSAFTTKELRELGELADLDVVLDPADLVLDESSRLVVEQDRVAARNLAVLQGWAGRPATGAAHRVHLHFWTSPVGVLGDRSGRGRRGGPLGRRADGLVRPVGEPWTIPAQLVVRAVGYRGLRLAGVPVRRQHRADPARRGPGDPGRHVLARRVRDRLDQARADRRDRDEPGRRRRDCRLAAHRRRPRRARARGTRGALGTLLAARGLHPLGMPEWHRIDAAEVARGQEHGRLRTTLAHRGELLEAAAEPKEALTAFC